MGQKERLALLVQKEVQEEWVLQVKKEIEENQAFLAMMVYQVLRSSHQNDL